MATFQEKKYCNPLLPGGVKVLQPSWYVLVSVNRSILLSDEGCLGPLRPNTERYRGGRLRCSRK